MPGISQSSQNKMSQMINRHQESKNSDETSESPLNSQYLKNTQHIEHIEAKENVTHTQPTTALRLHSESRSSNHQINIASLVSLDAIHHRSQSFQLSDRLNRFAKASAVLGAQSLVNMVPVWMGLNKAAGMKTPWHDCAAVATALTVVCVTDWLRNLSHGTYFQLTRAALPECSGNRREFIAAMSTCALDLLLAVPLINIRQKVATHPSQGFAQIKDIHFKDYYEGLVGVAANNLVYTNTLFPSIEITSRLMNVSDYPRIQSMLGAICCVVAGAAAWPIEVGRVLMTQENSPNHSISDLMKSPDFNLQLIAKSFAPMIMVYACAGFFTGLANMYLRQSFQSTHQHSQYQPLASSQVDSEIDQAEHPMV